MTKPPHPDFTRHALFLDFDGTLIDFGPTPNEIEVSKRVQDVLDGLLLRFDGAVAFITGRSVLNLIDHLKRADFLMAGGHGAEWMVPGSKVESVSTDPFDKEAKVIGNFAAADDRLVLENKLTGLTLHYRQAPDREDEVRALFLSTFKDRSDFEVMDGHFMQEARPAGVNKGSAIETLMRRPVMADRTPIFLGDDTTDEFGFAAVNDLGGMSVRVGGGETIATHALEDVDAVINWLEEALK